MPNIKSKKKHLRQTKKRSARNKAVVSRVRNIIKKLKALPGEEAKKLIPEAYSVIDKAVQNKKIKKGTAARYKSRLSTAAAKK